MNAPLEHDDSVLVDQYGRVGLELDFLVVAEVDLDLVAGVGDDGLSSPDIEFPAPGHVAQSHYSCTANDRRSPKQGGGEHQRRRCSKAPHPT